MRPSRKCLRTAFSSSFAVLAVAALTGVAQAQLSSAQQNAMKQSCRSDFMSHCSGVSPGGKDALTCLQKNVASLSPACQQAVNATMPAPAAPKQAAPAAAPAAATAVAAPAPAAVAPAPKQPTAAQQSAMKQSCRNDFMSHCSGVSPGGKDALACLQRNVAGLSPACKKVVSATIPAAAKTVAKTAAKTAAAPAAVAPAAAPAVAVAPAAGPTPQQLKAVKFTCRADFKRNCKGIQPGGPEALACLQRNAPRLTPDCKTSLADIADSLPAPAATPTVAAVPPPPPAARRPLPPGITPVGRVLRRVIKRERELGR